MAAKDCRPPGGVCARCQGRQTTSRNDDLQLAAFEHRKGAVAQHADQGRGRLARHVDRDHRAPLRPVHQASHRRSDPRGVARHHTVEPARQRRRFARLSCPVARALTDQAWADICAAASPHRPDTEARAVLSAVLFEEYPAFAYNRERVITAQERAERMLELLDAFAELYRQAWRPQLPADEFEAILAGRAEAFIADNVKTERDLWSIARLRQRTEAVLEYNTTIRQAN